MRKPLPNSQIRCPWEPAEAAGDLPGAGLTVEQLLRPEPDPRKDGVLPRAMALCAAWTGNGAADALGLLVSEGSSLTHEARMEARFALWRATRDATHLREARRLLDHLVRYAPQRDRESMCTHVPLHRDILDAGDDPSLHAST